VEKHGIEKFNNFLADLQIWGRPEEVVEKLKAMVERFDVGSFIIYTQFGDMPFDVGRDNYELFARKVLPHLKDIDVSAPMAAPSSLQSVA
jgi:alkanesulfonate monooxygenase SsuD/methylene tetrahydromethanopterin reductase-like flavin-dependent oxidoreductase (luciferase family)